MSDERGNLGTGHRPDLGGRHPDDPVFCGSIGKSPAASKSRVARLIEYGIRDCLIMVSCYYLVFATV
ncbi:hypothetical protein ABT009_36120 [Streptomyces sp. NPDC002896]|uniref:hypothetical protein n=1 Tax=Streptomyces sp. NPDC002896 TaxID=3154438 RepID=UPI003321077B